jgi:integrase
MKTALTDAFVRSVKPPATGRKDISDQSCRGLEYRIAAGGARTWSFRFYDRRSGRDGRITIGPYPEISLSIARERADELRRQVVRGDNPVAIKRREREDADAKSFAHLAGRYLEEHARRHKRSADADERNMRLHVLPNWKRRRYDDIQRRDVIELVERLIIAGKPVLANRVHSLISKVFSFAVDADLLDHHPCARMRKRGAETVRRRVLDDDEIRLVWSKIVLPPVSRAVGLALRLQLLTACRAGEVAGLRRSEVEHLDDRTRAALLIPAARTKNKRDHLVPLSPLAKETISEALKLVAEDQPFVFPSPTVRDAPITSHALSVAMTRFAESLKKGDPVVKKWLADRPTSHDMRRTARTRFSALGISREDCDAILHHTPQDVGRKHYDLYDREPEKRRALVRWANALEGILTNSKVEKVVPIRSARARERHKKGEYGAPASQ